MIVIRKIHILRLTFDLNVLLERVSCLPRLLRFEYDSNRTADDWEIARRTQTGWIYNLAGSELLLGRVAGGWSESDAVDGVGQVGSGQVCNRCKYEMSLDPCCVSGWNQIWVRTTGSGLGWPKNQIRVWEIRPESCCSAWSWGEVGRWHEISDWGRS